MRQRPLGTFLRPRQVLVTGPLHRPGLVQYMHERREEQSWRRADKKLSAIRESRVLSFFRQPHCVVNVPFVVPQARKSSLKPQLDHELVLEKPSGVDFVAAAMPDKDMGDASKYGGGEIL
jgi:hypothetical protein